jgi:hypothetical protein
VLEIKTKKILNKYKQKKINFGVIIPNIVFGIFIFVGIYLLGYFLSHIELYGYGIGGVALLLLGLSFLGLYNGWGDNEEKIFKEK